MPTKPKTKPPIDRENAIDVTPANDDLGNEQGFPSTEDPQFLVKMRPGVTIAETMEIMMALLFQAVGAPLTGEKGSLSQFVLRQSYVDKLSDRAAANCHKVEEVAPAT